MSRNYSSIFNSDDAEMLQDADNAITSCDLWDWLKAYEPEDGKGFVFSDHPNVLRINNAMKYGGHSGSSYNWTMRTMQYLSKIGWASFEVEVREEHRKYAEEERLKELARAADNAVYVINKAYVNTNGNINPLAIAEASRGVPGFEGQADAMKRFSEGKMSYAEMRNLCG